MNRKYFSVEEEDPTVETNDEKRHTSQKTGVASEA